MNELLYPKSRELVPAGAAIVVGQRVHCILYGGQYGIVSAVHGPQAPASVGNIAGVMSYGGKATFDIVFSDHLSLKLPEAIIRGVQWRVYAEVASADEIAEAKAVCQGNIAEKAMKEKLAEQRREAARENHLLANPHLKPIKDSGLSPGKCAAMNIRLELRKAFPSTKFSVRSEYDKVDISWSYGPTTREVEAIVDKYQGGSFNGMEDIYEYNENATFAHVFGDPKYVFCHRHLGDGLENYDIVAKAYCEMYGLKYEGVNGKMESIGCYATEFARSVLYGTSYSCGEADRVIITGIVKLPSEKKRGHQIADYYEAKYQVIDKKKGGARHNVAE